MRVDKTRLLRTGLVLCTLLISTVATADRSDWVAVKRFDSQLKQAESGEISAMYDTARALERGRGTDLDYQAAAQWYQKAKDSGHAPSTGRLGLLYFEGRGVKQNHKKAANLLSQAARKDIPSAQYQLATMYQYGTGVKQNRSKAIFWFEKARVGGDYRSEVKLKQLKSKQSTKVAKIAVTTKPVAQAKPAKKPVIRTKTATKIHPTMLSVLQGKWKKNNRHAGYLPSTVNACNKTSNISATCTTQLQKRQTDSEIITYNTKATLSSFKKRRFVIHYTNTIVDVKIREIDPSMLDEDEVAPTLASSQIKVGDTSKQHEMQCELVEKNHIRCTRDKIHTYNFQG